MINLRTTTRVNSARDMRNIESDLRKIERRIPGMYTTFRMAAAKCITVKQTMRYVDHMGSSKACQRDAKLQAIVDSIRAEKPNYSLHDVHVGLEGLLEDYSKRVATFAQTMVTTVNKYAVGLFDLFMKKLTINKKIDVSKFVGVDSSMRLIVMTYGDYCELGHPIVEQSSAVVKDVADWHAALGRVRKALGSKDQNEIKKNLEAFTKKIHEGPLVSYLKDHNLVDFEFGQDSNNSGTEGLIKIVPSKRFQELETSQILSQAGWEDVDKLKNSLILQHVEPICKQLSQLYKLAVDLIDEARRISSDYCVKEPYVCAAIVKYGTLVAQMVNCYTKAFDMCWTTCLRVSQACLVEEN